MGTQPSDCLVELTNGIKTFKRLYLYPLEFLEMTLYLDIYCYIWFDFRSRKEGFLAAFSTLFFNAVFKNLTIFVGIGKLIT